MRTTETMQIADVQASLLDVLDDIDEQGKRIVVVRGGASIAAIISLNDLRRLRWLDERDREAREVVESMRAAFDDVPDEEIERQTERIMAEIREENRAVRERVAKTA
jgi:hypothetical protein